MRILQVAHSFIPHTIAGTEVYTYALSKELLRRHELFVFFRVNNRREREYALACTMFEGLQTFAINNTFRSCSSFRDTYSNHNIDRAFGELLDKIRPDVVHIQHLLFLSHGIVKEIKKRNIPTVYTLHDYWLLCYRGQLLKENLTLCHGNSILECSHCLRYLLSIKKYSMYLYSILRKRLPTCLLELLKIMNLIIARSDSPKQLEDWRNSIKDVCLGTDLFIAPSNFIKNKFVEYGFPENKMLYFSNGLNSSCFTSIAKIRSNKLKFCYIGTLLPTKGLNVLISAFKKLNYQNVELLIYGKPFPYSGFEFYPKFLKSIAKGNSRIKLLGAYDNKDVGKILADIDVVVLPSLWPENAPLIIQEAFLSKTAVIASRIGGIPELINDGSSGLLFNPGDEKDLQEKMEYIIDNPDVIENFARNMSPIKSIEENAKEMEEIYINLISKK